MKTLKQLEFLLRHRKKDLDIAIEKRRKAFEAINKIEEKCELISNQIESLEVEIGKTKIDNYLQSIKD